jgi:insulysin
LPPTPLTPQFPGSGEYKRYIKENDGRCNASTSQHLTTYFFEVAAPALLGGLDRFTGFFVDPLFSKDSVDREVNAIHSEYLGKYTSMGRVSAIYEGYR